MASFVGSTLHKELLVGFFTETHAPYRPADLPWPVLAPDERERLAQLPIWEEALKIEAKTAVIVTTKGETEPDPQLAEAIRLQGYEEARHADLLTLLTQRYEIPVPTFTAAPPRNPDWAFMRIGYGECFDSFFAFGLFALARDSGLFPPALAALFEPVMQEEGRHILFHVNWLAYTQRRLPFALRPSYVFSRGLAIWMQLLARIRTALHMKGKTPDKFTLNTHQRFSDISARAFLELCLAENERRLAPYDARLLRPSFVPTIARAVLDTLPGD